MTHKHNKWLQILAEEDFSPKLLWRENADLKFSAREQRRRRRQQETAEQKEHRLEQRRQRRQLEAEEQETGIRGIMIVQCRKPIPGRYM